MGYNIMAVKSKGSITNRFFAFFKRQGYLRFGDFAERRLIKRGQIGFLDFPKIQKALKQSGSETSLRGYVGMALFSSLIATIISLLIGLLLISFIFLTTTDLFSTLFLFLFGVISSFLIGILVFFGIIKLPNLSIKNRAVSLESALPTVSSYMSAMTSAGVPPAPIFASLAAEKSLPKVVTQEADRINRDIEILGLDVLRALEAAAYRSPSERWAGFLQGMIGTVNSGGDLTQYLSTETKSFMKLKQEKTKEFIENLGVLAEIFMVLGVVTPLFFVVMVAILSILSEDNQGSVVLLFTITYLIIPLLMIMQYVLTTVGETEEV
jgi:flagellar protein FlaJ